MTSSKYFNGPQCVKDRSDEPRGNRDVPLFDLSTVASATNNFSVLNKLGRGGFGSVYKVNFHYTTKLVRRIDKDLHIGNIIDRALWTMEWK